MEHDPIKKDILQKLEYVFTALFTMEMLLKWIGIGVTRYFTTVWCILDCAIVAVSKIDKSGLIRKCKFDKQNKKMPHRLKRFLAFPTLYFIFSPRELRCCLRMMSFVDVFINIDYVSSIAFRLPGLVFFSRPKRRSFVY